jgi:hypothetical protein
MPTVRLVWVVFLTCLCASSAQPQDVVSASTPASNSKVMHRGAVCSVHAPINQSIALTVPKGTAVQIVLDGAVRIQKVGQSVHGRVAEPVYAFDKLVVPVGTEVAGRIIQLDGVSSGRRILDALNADFSPPRKVQIEFDDLDLTDGRHIPIDTSVTPGSGQVIQFVTSGGRKKRKSFRNVASRRADQAKEQAKRQWDNAMKQVRESGKMHRVLRYAVAQLPVHPQYLVAGTVYFAELEQPLDFGSEPLTPETAASISQPSLLDSSVHVRLMTGLSSATAKKGEEIEAVLSQPAFDGNRLVIPQGSRLKGSVVQVRPARRFSRNGQLRMAFDELVLSDGIEQKVEASLLGVQSTKGQGVKLDSEGGAEANSPKTRYLATGISVALALASSHTDNDARDGDVGGNTNNRVAGGAGGFKLVGIAMGALVHSQPLGMAMGAYGASMSIYSHFIARGRDLVFPKNTAMEIAIETRARTPSPSSRKAVAAGPADPTKQ